MQSPPAWWGGGGGLSGEGSEIFILVGREGNFVGGSGEGGEGGGGLLKRFALFSYLNHSFTLSLNVKVCIRFIVFLRISLCFLFAKSYVG